MVMRIRCKVDLSIFLLVTCVIGFCGCAEPAPSSIANDVSPGMTVKENIFLKNGLYDLTENCDELQAVCLQICGMGELLRPISVRKNEVGDVEIVNLWNVEAQENINQYLYKMNCEIRELYENVEENPPFFCVEIEYLSRDYMSIRYEIWSDSKYMEQYYEIVVLRFVFDLRDGHRVLLNELMSVEDAVTLCEPKEIYSIQENIDYLYTEGVRERVSDLTEEELKNYLEMCSMTEMEYIQEYGKIYDKATFGIYEGKILFDFVWMSEFCVDKTIDAVGDT